MSKSKISKEYKRSKRIKVAQASIGKGTSSNNKYTFGAFGAPASKGGE